MNKNCGLSKLIAISSIKRLVRRFSSHTESGKLIEALQRQVLVAGDLKLARNLSQHVAVEGFRRGRSLIRQDDSTNDLYFLLCGTVSIRVNKREIAIRKAGEHFGEMALLDTTSLRSASALACETVVVARISEEMFTKVAAKYPELWRRMATTLASRIRERNRFHVPPREQPVVFIGSSKEGLKIAERIYRYLKQRPLVPKLWSDGVFQSSKTTIEDLIRTSETCDYAILVLTPDDVIVSRSKKSLSPRDNVVFELGLFMGALSRERAVVVTPLRTILKTPTDLLGLTQVRLPYHATRGSRPHELHILRDLAKTILEAGPI
jgi:CRP/FNR family cyclic AMP-dependent transcriptional regulator